MAKHIPLINRKIIIGILHFFGKSDNMIKRFKNKNPPKNLKQETV